MSDVTDSPERNAAARLRVEKALNHIQNAQGELGRAMAELSAITGGAYAYWQKGNKVYDQIHAYWYKVAELRNGTKAAKLGLDHEPRERSAG